MRFIEPVDSCNRIHSVLASAAFCVGENKPYYLWQLQSCEVYLLVTCGYTVHDTV